MKKLIAIAAMLGALASSAFAQSVKIATVDFGQVYDQYYKVTDAKNRFESSAKQAGEEIRRMQEEAKPIVDELNKMSEQIKDPTLSETAKQEIQKQAQPKVQKIQEKDAEIKHFLASTNQLRQKEILTFQATIAEEIKAEVARIAKDKGYQLVLETSGRSSIGIDDRGNITPLIAGANRTNVDMPAVLFADPQYDITRQVLEKLNASKPATK